GLLLLLCGLIGDMEGIETGLLPRPVVALGFILRLLGSRLAGARKGVHLERRRQRFGSRRLADERTLRLDRGKRAGGGDQDQEDFGFHIALSQQVAHSASTGVARRANEIL